MKLKSLFATFVLVAMTAVPAFAVSWAKIGEGHYIDVDSIRPSQAYGSYTFDTKYLSTGEPLEEINGKKVYTINTNSFMDCRTSYGKTLTYTGLDEAGRVVVRGRDVQKQWNEINAPGSRAYETFLFVCSDRYLQQYPRYNRLWWY